MNDSITKADSFYGKSRTQFMSQKDAIKALLDQGYPMTVVWRGLKAQGVFDAKYDQFVAYVRRFIRADQKPKAPGRLSPKPSNSSPGHSHSEHAVKGPRIAFEREEKKINDWNISTIGKEYLLEPANKS